MEQGLGFLLKQFDHWPCLYTSAKFLLNFINPKLQSTSFYDIFLRNRTQCHTIFDVKIIGFGMQNIKL